MDQSPSRQIRVFVSSTFRDMQAERDELVKRIFPRLRKLCEQRGVTWGEVDLRWGVTDEQAADGMVLPICLEEIQRCRPFFIGLLGERYGWIPDEIPSGLIDQEQWLGQYPDRSVTELEIMHGVLNKPEMAGNTFFYFRDPAYLDSLPGNQSLEFREHATPDEINKYGQEGAARQVEDRIDKLGMLKARIRYQKLPLRDNYPTPQVLGELVFSDLKGVIDRLFPEGKQPGPLVQEAAEHEAFARSRAGVYIGGEKYYSRLTAHLDSDGPPLVVLGESGIGKSALLSNWAISLRKKHPDLAFLVHFIGATSYSADWYAMLRRIMADLGHQLNVKTEIPDQPDALRQAFAAWLTKIPSTKRVVLILDGLNQLEDRDQAPDLVWLPTHIPSNIRIFLSTLPGRSLDAIQKRGWSALQVTPLNIEERKRLITEYLAQYRKKLNPIRVERLAGSSQCANPLFLRVLLEELRLFGVHELLDEAMQRYLSSASISELYGKVLTRCEQDYERERPGLVGDSMKLLWAARRGLTEAELLELLGGNESSLPQAYWSPLHLALEASLVNRSGLLGFSHNYLREAVQNRYLDKPGTGLAVHMHLADYFHKRELGSRRIDEEPWQLSKAAAWQKLCTLLGDLAFFNTAYSANQYEIRSYWSQIEAGSDYRMVDAYRQVLDNPRQHPEQLVWSLGHLLALAGHSHEAQRLQEQLSDHFRQTGHVAAEASTLGTQAVILRNRGDLEGALALHKQEEKLCRKTGDKHGLQRTLGNQALILRMRGDLKGALSLLKDQESLCRKIGEKAGLAGSLNGQALVSKDRGDPNGAMKLNQEAERICREGGFKMELQESLNGQALLLQARGDRKGALALHKEVERLCRELGLKPGLLNSLGNQAVLLQDQGDLNGAMTQYTEVEQLCRELENKPNLARTLGNLAQLQKARGDLERAMIQHREEEKLWRELGDRRGLAVCLTNQAVILGLKQGKPGEALPKVEEAFRLAYESGYAPLVQWIGSVRADIQRRKG